MIAQILNTCLCELLYQIPVEVSDRAMVALFGLVCGLLYTLFMARVYFKEKLRLSQTEIEHGHSELKEASDALNLTKESLSKSRAEFKTLHDRFSEISQNIVSEKTDTLNTYGSHPDTICSLAGLDFDSSNSSPIQKNLLYDKFMKEFKLLKSPKFIKSFSQQFDQSSGFAVTRFAEQLPDLYKKNPKLIAMIMGGLSPLTIALILDIKMPTFYTIRNRYRSYIAKSNALDKEEFLKYFAS